ncbi:hypothetical protein ACT3HK_13845 [Thermolongibacillus altinsuensis]
MIFIMNRKPLFCHRRQDIPNVKRMADKFICICLMAFSFGEVAEKLVHIGKLYTMLIGYSYE